MGAQSVVVCIYRRGAPCCFTLHSWKCWERANGSEGKKNQPDKSQQVTDRWDILGSDLDG
jgi:hypothetical protein